MVLSPGYMKLKKSKSICGKKKNKGGDVEISICCKKNQGGDVEILICCKKNQGGDVEI